MSVLRHQPYLYNSPPTFVNVESLHIYSDGSAYKTHTITLQIFFLTRQCSLEAINETKKDICIYPQTNHTVSFLVFILYFILSYILTKI